VPGRLELAAARGPVSARMRYSTVLFDLDGTIIDSAEGILKSFAYALTYFGVAVPDEEALRQYIGPPLLDSFQNGFGFPPDKATAATAKYRERYGTVGLRECRAYDGIPALLRELHGNGRNVVLATSKPEIYARQILENLGLADCFTQIVGSTLDGSRDSKTAVMRYALDSLQITDLSGCLMVGDRMYDGDAAAALGMDFAGVLYGFGSREELESAKAKYIAETVEALRALLF